VTEEIIIQSLSPVGNKVSKLWLRLFVD
jgi:hypothetical protein